MNTTTLNMTTLDGGVIIKRGGGGNAPSAKPKWTGHADADGLKAIGWTDEDIAYYQANGVNWNEEDDEWHKVTEDNKALYGVLTAYNISTYKDRIVYLPKIDTSGVTSMNGMFSSCRALTAIPMLDTSKVTTMTQMFEYCYALTSIPMLDTSSVDSMDYMFYGCRSLPAIPMLDTNKVTNISNMFRSCTSFTVISQINMPRAADTRSVFSDCSALTALAVKLGRNIGQAGNMFDKCYSLVTLHIDGVCADYDLSYSPLLSKDSLLYIINNNNATNYSGITITLHSYTYERLAADPDIVEALTNYPKVKIASA